jgi:PPOX class probable FMN-dependent enzyme
MTELRTAEELRAHYAEPHPLAVNKELRRLDHHCRKFIGLAPFAVIATADAAGRADATPRGDAPGFVLVVDDRTLLVPDRTGNNRVDTMLNIVENPHVGLLFMVPGMVETLRVNGRATITIDLAVLERLAAGGKPPRAAIRVDIEEVYFQCGKALVRSELWNAEKHVPRDTFPPFGKIFSEHSKTRYDPAIEAILDEEYRSGLY